MKPILNPAYLPEISSSDFAVREEIRLFAIEESDLWYRQYLEILYQGWESYNSLYFGGEMRFPLILISEPSSPRALGDCAIYNGFGGRSQIRIRPSVLTGEHRVFERQDPREGVQRYFLDVLLHEMIHQWQDEIVKDDEATYKGHGPTFAAKCNEIGDELGLSLVSHRKSKKAFTPPRCSYWPMIVRDPDYYLGVLKPSVHGNRTKRAPKKGPESETGNIVSILEVVRQLPTDKRGVLLQKLWGNYADELRRFENGESPETIWQGDDEENDD